MRGKLECVHNNPVKRGLVEQAEHWRYSSVRVYLDEPELRQVDRSR
jgi:hypothetical protein